MRLRRSKTHVTKNGTPRYSVRVVESVRVGKKVRQKTLLNLGTDFPIPPERWARLNTRINALYNGHDCLFDDQPDLEAAADVIVARVRARQFRPGDDRAIATVDLNTLDHHDARSVGGERLALHALDALGVRECLEQLGVARRQAAIAIALIAARILHPSSEREAHRWLHSTSSLLELLSLDRGPAVSLNNLYETNDILWTHNQELQRHLFERERELFDLTTTTTLFDLTNIHTTGHYDPNRGGLRQFGRSKQKRNDCPLVSLALMVDGGGFPRACEVLPGNVSEPATLADAIDRLEQECGPLDRPPTIVMDAGIATKENLEWLRRREYPWLCVSRAAVPDRPDREPDFETRTQSNQQLKAWTLETGGKEGRLYVESEARKATGEAIRSRQTVKFEAALVELDQGLTKPGCTKRVDRVHQRIGRIKQKYAKVSGHYEITVVEDAKGRNAVAVQFRRRPSRAKADSTAGAYVLHTSHSDWSPQKVLHIHHSLTEVEGVFRSLKSEMGLRPVHHRLDRRIAAHLFISVLAYHAVHWMRCHLKRRGIDHSWTTVRATVVPWTRLTTSVREVGGELVSVRQDVLPRPEVGALLRAIGGTVELHRVRWRNAQN